MIDNTKSLELTLKKAQMTEWAENCLRINHLITLVQSALEKGNKTRASHLSERARRRAWKMFNEMIVSGAEKPSGYCELDTE